MKRVRTIVMAFAISTLSPLMFACSTAPVQAPLQAAETFVKQGDTVYLFHGGSKVAKQEFCVGSTVPVYRYEGKNSSLGSTPVAKREVGKIKIVKDLGEYYAQGVVVEGTLKKGDVAVQAHSGCLVEVSEP